MDENYTTFWYDDHTVFGMIISGMKFIPLFFAVSAWVWMLLCRCMIMRLMMDNPDSLCPVKELESWNRVLELTSQIP